LIVVSDIYDRREYYSPDTKIEDIPNHDRKKIERVISIEVFRTRENQIINLQW
jgi:hypothetical protein